MARSQRTSNPVTLFPFLAVLLCTIGALVLMLVVVSAGIRKDAVATARQKQKAQSEVELPEQTEPPLSIVDAVPESQLEDATASPTELVLKTDDRDQKPIDPVFAKELPPSPIQVAPPRTLAEISELEHKVHKLEAEVAARASRLQSVNVKTHALRKQLQTVKAQQDDLQLAIIRTATQRAKLEESTGELRVENQQIIEWLDESRKLIDEHKDQLISPLHSIVTYDGQTGTVRRPIIIECVDDVLRFEAEQVEIPINVQQRFGPEQNPLASGVKALFRYWVAKQRTEDPQGKLRKPYALILVRPSGAKAFSSAVFALDQMVGDFGYELVESDFLYEVPETTADAVRECRAAVEAEIRRGPTPSRRTLGPNGPMDISRVARAPAASRNFFNSPDFQKRRTGGSAGTNGLKGENSDRAASERTADNSVAEGKARWETEAQATAERVRQLLSGREAEAASLLNKGTPSGFDKARAAVLAEAARVEEELRRSREVADLSGLPESFKNQIAARSRKNEFGDNPFSGQLSSDQTFSDKNGNPDGDHLAASPMSQDRVRRERSGQELADQATANGRPRWIDGSVGRPAVGNGEVVGSIDSALSHKTAEGAGSGAGKRSGNSSTEGNDSSGLRGNSASGGSERRENSGSSRRGAERAAASGDFSQGTPVGPASSKFAVDGQEATDSEGQPAGKRATSDGQEISSLLNSSAGEASNASSSLSTGNTSSNSAGGPTISSRLRSNRIPSLKTQRRWGRSHPDASLGLERVVEIRIEPTRIIVGNKFQVTRRPERSEAEVVKLTIQTIEHLADQWGFPPPRFYWVPSVRLAFEAEESRLGKILEEAIEDAGAALEQPIN